MRLFYASREREREKKIVNGKNNIAKRKKEEESKISLVKRKRQQTDNRELAKSVETADEHN